MSLFACGFAAVLGIVLGGSPAQAQTTYYWTTTSGAMTAGSGTMDTATPNWSTTITGDSSLHAWSGGSQDTADFYANSSPTSTIAVNGNQTVGNIAFDGSGYTLSGGTLNMSPSGGSITVNSSNAAIGSVIAGTNLTKAGSGVLTLTSARLHRRDDHHGRRPATFSARGRKHAVDHKQFVRHRFRRRRRCPPGQLEQQLH